MKHFLLPIFLLISQINLQALQANTVAGLPLYYYQEKHFTNFGDFLSKKLMERIVGGNIRIAKINERKFLCIGSILILARTHDVLWGTGMNAKRMDNYHFTDLDIRAVRGPLTRNFIMSRFGIDCPEVYGDPGLLVPYFFPEFKKPQNPANEYVIVPHYKDNDLFPKEEYPNVVYPTERWDIVIKKILNSKFVISGSLHGLIIAEAFGIPARYLRVSEYEPLFKYQDYYLGTNRLDFKYATSVDEALELGGEPPFECDLEKLYEAFPFEFWPNANFKIPDFTKKI